MDNLPYNELFKKSEYRFEDGHVTFVGGSGYMSSDVIKTYERQHGNLVSVKRNGRTVLAV